MTRRPAAATSRAAIRPARPPPTTTTSTSATIALQIVGYRSRREQYLPRRRGGSTWSGVTRVPRLLVRRRPSPGRWRPRWTPPAPRARRRIGLILADDAELAGLNADAHGQGRSDRRPVVPAAAPGRLPAAPGPPARRRAPRTATWRSRCRPGRASTWATWSCRWSGRSSRPIRAEAARPATSAGAPATSSGCS